MTLQESQPQPELTFQTTGRPETDVNMIEDEEEQILRSTLPI
jgi:hypothetical protein